MSNYDDIDDDVLLDDNDNDGWGSDNFDIDVDADDDNVHKNDDDLIDDENTNTNNYNTHMMKEKEESIYRASTPITNNRKLVATVAAVVDRPAVVTKAPPSPPPPPPPLQQPTTEEISHSNNNNEVVDDDDFGWGDEDELDLDDDNDFDNNNTNDNNNNNTPVAAAKTTTTMSSSNNRIQNESSIQQTNLSMNHSYNNNNDATQLLVHELHEYIVSIPKRIHILDDILCTQYNTQTKAIEIQQYYMERPQLLQYTINKELLRMDYTIIMINNPTNERVVVQDKDQIAVILSSLEQQQQGNNQSSSILGRCANQSILVDVLQAMSASTSTSNDDYNNENDMVVLLPSKYMCTAIATKCHFTIDLIHNTVSIDVLFTISLPLLNKRWDIGQVQIYIQYKDNNGSSSMNVAAPTIQYQIVNYESFIVDPQSPIISQNINISNNVNDEYVTNLQQFASLLKELSFNKSDTDPTAIPTTLASNNMGQQQQQQQQRDAFVQQILLSSNSIAKDVVVDGMKSAWQDFDTATGLVSKLKYIPSLLPDINPVEEEEIHHHEQQQYDNNHHQPRFASNSVQYQQDSGSSFQNQQHMMQQQQQNATIGRQQPVHPNSNKNNSNRPTSILGGFVRSLAKSVALPQEDPSIYQEWQKQNEQYSKPYPSNRATSDNNSAHGVTIPKLYNEEKSFHTNDKSPSTGLAGATTSIPRLYNIENVVPSVSKPPHQRLSPQFENNQYTSISSSKTLASTSQVRTSKNETHIPITMNFPPKNASTACNRSTNPENEPISNEGWDDDSDFDIDEVEPPVASGDTDCIMGLSADTQQTKHTECPGTQSSKIIINNNHSPKPTEVANGWVYDTVTDIIPTCTRYRNPIGGSRDLRYF